MNDSKDVLSSLFSRQNVHIQNKESFLSKLQSIAKDGMNKLQVISDFDMTITKHKHLNKRCPSCHNILEQNDFVPDDVKGDLRNLFNKYYPIEIDHSLSREEKIPHMVDWWTTAHDTLTKSSLRKDDLTMAVQNSLAMLREGTKEFFDILYYYQIPLLIFSAGVGDVLEEIIRQQATLHPNIKTVSNFMEFDENGKLVGFQENLIHTLNKNKGALKDSDYFEKTSQRNNVLLLGDMLGDASMAEGVQDLSVCLRVGFLNDKVDERLKEFLDVFDIVIIEDDTMDVPDILLKHVLKV